MSQTTEQQIYAIIGKHCKDAAGPIKIDATEIWELDPDLFARQLV